MKHDVAFLHTASGHVATFGELMAELAPDLNARHDVDERLLAEARSAGGIGPDLEARINRAVLGAASSGASVVVCTCSTIGSVAERVGGGSNLITQRLDRAMANAAVMMGPRVLVVAALQSTLRPTRELIASSAYLLSSPVVTTELVVQDAWHYFERSMQQEYIERITAAIRGGTEEADVVVLAQASMAAAADLCLEMGIPVLASPRLGVEAAIVAHLLSAGRQENSA